MATRATSKIRQPRTGSRTRFATRSCSRARSCGGTTAAFAEYEQTRRCSHCIAPSARRCRGRCGCLPRCLPRSPRLKHGHAWRLSRRRGRGRMLRQEEPLSSASPCALHQRERFECHTLRLAANGPNGLEIPSPNVVVDRSATDLQNLGGAVDGNGFHNGRTREKGRRPSKDARPVWNPRVSRRAEPRNTGVSVGEALTRP